ncbi:MAG TPA: hypothetical protein VF101_18695 [Gaiellaceae bacterium]
MSNFPALDVAIGLSFVYFVLSLVCSALNESVAAITARRAKFLREGLRTLLSSGSDPPTGALAQLYKHPLVANMIREPREVLGRKLRTRYPSYLPSRTFAVALLDFPKQGEAAPAHGRSITDAVAAIDNAEVRRAIRALVREGDTQVEHIRHRIEQWYDDAMERVSGWYRRRVQVWLWVFSILVAIVLNADSLQIARTLWTQPTTRAQVAQAAQNAVEQGQQGQQATKRLKELEATNLPIGWHFGKNSGKDPRRFPGWFNYAFFVKLVGLLLTACALTLGAPFWFDALSRIARIRSSGAPPPASDAVRKGEGEQQRVGPVTA